MWKIVVAIALVLIGVPVRAEVLATPEMPIRFGTSRIGYPATVTMGLGGAGGTAILLSEVFDVATADRLLVIDSGPLFDVATALLTNGIDDNFFIDVNASAAGGLGLGPIPESSFLSGSAGQRNGIDLNGSVIQSIQVEVINRIASPGISEW